MRLFGEKTEENAADIGDQDTIDEMYDEFDAGEN